MTTNDDAFMHPLSMVDGHEASSNKIHVILVMSICMFTHRSDDVVCKEVNFVGFSPGVWSVITCS